MIFLDTGFLTALVNKQDRQHLRVRRAFEPYRGRRLADFVLTTNHVVAESITLLGRRGHRDPRARHRLAVEAGQRLRAGGFGRVHHATVEDEAAAFDDFARHEDKQYSFTDCSSFVLMERLGIEEAFSVDADFTHRFRAIPGPPPQA